MTSAPEPLCPMTADGAHKKRPWAGDGRSGLACVCCSKTWQHVGKELVATYDLLQQRQRESGDTNVES